MFDRWPLPLLAFPLFFCQQHSGAQRWCVARQSRGGGANLFFLRLSLGFLLCGVVCQGPYSEGWYLQGGSTPQFLQFSRDFWLFSQLCNFPQFLSNFTPFSDGLRWHPPPPIFAIDVRNPPQPGSGGGGPGAEGDGGGAHPEQPGVPRKGGSAPPGPRPPSMRGVLTPHPQPPLWGGVDLPIHPHQNHPKWVGNPLIPKISWPTQPLALSSCQANPRHVLPGEGVQC